MDRTRSEIGIVDQTVSMKTSYGDIHINNIANTNFTINIHSDGLAVNATMWLQRSELETLRKCIDKTLERKV